MLDKGVRVEKPIQVQPRSVKDQGCVQAGDTGGVVGGKRIDFYVHCLDLCCTSHDPGIRAIDFCSVYRITSYAVNEDQKLFKRDEKRRQTPQHRSCTRALSNGNEGNMTV